MKALPFWDLHPEQSVVRLRCTMNDSFDTSGKSSRDDLLPQADEMPETPHAPQTKPC